MVSGKKLNSGAYGVTFLVVGALGRHYVIKFLKSAADPELEILKSIPKEAYKQQNLCQYFFIAENLRDENLRDKFPTLTDIHCKPQAMICMQAIPNGELFDLIKTASQRSSKFSEETIRRFARDIIKGMACLATHNVTHGDLKPENLLIDSSARVIIIDLGVAKKHVPWDGSAGSTSEPAFAIESRPSFLEESTLLTKLKGMPKEDLKALARKIGVENDALAHADASGKNDPTMAIMNLILDKVNTSLLARLQQMTLKVLKAKALQAGVEKSAVDEVDDSEDPKEKNIQLILGKKATKTSLDQLERLPLDDLKTKAREEGVGKNAIDNAGQKDPRLAIMNLILNKAIDPLEKDSALLAELNGMSLRDLKKKAGKEGLDTESVDDAKDPKEKTIQLILDKKAVELETGTEKVSAATPVLELLCTGRVRDGGTDGYNPPERRYSDPYNCARGDVFTVGLIFLMMKWTVNPATITNNERGIDEQGLTPQQWTRARQDGATFSDDFKNLVNAMLRKDPQRRPTWAELADACDKMSSKEELKWLSLRVSEPLPFFLELKSYNPSIAKHLKSSEAVEALLQYVAGFKGQVVMDDDADDRVQAANAFKFAKTNDHLSAKELHEAIWRRAHETRKGMNASEMDLASLMCGFMGVGELSGMEEWSFKTMWKHLSSKAGEVAPLVGRNKVRYHAWETCGSSEEEECRKLFNAIDAMCKKTHGDLKCELRPDEAKNKKMEDGFFHVCLSLQNTIDQCHLHCDVFHLDGKVILESKRQYGSAVGEWEMLGAIQSAVDSEGCVRAKPPVVLTEEWLLPAMFEAMTYKVGEAKQHEGFEHVVLKSKPSGWNVTKVPNGEIMIILDEQEDSYKVKWTTIEGWAKKQNVDKIQIVQAIKPPGEKSDWLAKLKTMTLRDLKTRARTVNVDESTIDEADNTDNPKEAIIKHILQARPPNVQPKVQRQVFAQLDFDLVDGAGGKTSPVDRGDVLIIEKEEGNRFKVRRKKGGEGWTSKDNVGEKWYGGGTAVTGVTGFGTFVPS